MRSNIYDTLAPAKAKGIIYLNSINKIPTKRELQNPVQNAQCNNFLKNSIFNKSGLIGIMSNISAYIKVNVTPKQANKRIIRIERDIIY